MRQKTKNPGWQAGVSLELSSRVWSTSLGTAADWRVQLIARRYRITPVVAQEVARLCFGDAGHE